MFKNFRAAVFEIIYKKQETGGKCFKAGGKCWRNN